LGISRLGSAQATIGEAAMPAFADKIALQFGAVCVELPGQNTCVTRDGIFVKLVGPLAESDPIVVRLTVDGKTFEISAVVRNSYEEIGMFIKFLDCWPPGLHQLRDFVDGY
jgi:hypothetical protein